MISDHRKTLIIAAIASVLVLGIGVSIWQAERLERAASRDWLDKGRADAARMTDTVIFWTSKLEISLRAVAGQLRAQGSLDQARFEDLVDDVKNWDTGIRFDNFAYARRIAKTNRAAFERAQGAMISSVGDFRTPAPDDEEQYAVLLRSRDDGLIRINASLTTHKAMRSAILAAQRLPGDTILGPAYEGVDGDWYVPIAISTDLVGSSGVLVATIDLEVFFDALMANRLPSGMQFRFVERDNEARSEARLIPVFGAIEPPPNAVASEITRIAFGKAGWNLNWDILPEYRGGPDLTSSHLVGFGGSFLTILMVAIFGVLSFQNMRFHRLVQQRTAELSQHAMVIQLTMDTIDQGFVVWNSDYRLVVWSRSCVEFWYKPMGILRIGMHMKELLVHIAENGGLGDGDPVVLAEQEFQRVAAAGARSGESFAMMDKRSIHVRRFPLEKGGFVSVYTDITKQKAAEESSRAFNEKLERQVEERTRDLRHAIDEAVFANRVKSEFLANMSHELRTPLNSIIGFSQMLKDKVFGGIGGKKNEDYIENINQAGNLLLSIISDILDLSKIEVGEENLSESVFDVAVVIRECITMVKPRADSKSQSLTLSSEEEALQLQADQVKVKQVLLNLLTNAIKFTADGGLVEVRLARNGAGAIEIEVADNGIGISAEDIPRVTNPFEQLGDAMAQHKEGSGLGLALSKRLMGLHSGDLKIESQFGSGTTVTITFPPERTVRKKQPKAAQ
ncbi:MAG: PAS-domain containing protein [Rhodospirillales bacterium]|nr:PAS-domain containing protein [Rhodospirillales bacterium]